MISVELLHRLISIFFVSCARARARLSLIIVSFCLPGLSLSLINVIYETMSTMRKSVVTLALVSAVSAQSSASVVNIFFPDGAGQELIGSIITSVRGTQMSRHRPVKGANKAMSCRTPPKRLWQLLVPRMSAIPIVAISTSLSL